MNARPIGKREHRLLQEAAHREAGRGVASWRLLLKFKYITISPYHESAPDHILQEYPKWFRLDMEMTDRIRCAMERHIIACYAGQFAQMKFRRQRPQLRMGSDTRLTAQMASRICGCYQKTAAAYLRYCWLYAEDLVEEYWQPIELVAAALEEYRTLSRYAVSQVIYRADVRDDKEQPWWVDRELLVEPEPHAVRLEQRSKRCV